MAASAVALRSAKLSVAKPCRSVKVAASSRPLWLPEAKAPGHLTGNLAGDFGFDPLGLGQNPDRLKWYVEAEKTNGRWAMMAVAGIMGQELLGVDAKWYEAGAKEYDLPVIAQIPILFLVLGFLETKRYQGFKETGTSGFINSFPFDPAGMNSADMAVKEVKNGRLAMMALLGFAAQYYATGKGPVDNLLEHIADPFHKNFAENGTSIPFF